MTDQELEILVQGNLAIVYERRLEAIRNLTLAKLLRKNPYLFRAKGIRDASDFIESLLQAFLSSSEETIFGNKFFEPIAREALKSKGGMKTGSSGVDIEFREGHSHTAIAVKSSTNIQNSSAQVMQGQEFQKVHRTVGSKETAFDAILGFSYGRTSEGKKAYRRLAGQAFWQEVSGDSEFYLKILEAMKDAPQQHREEFDTVRANEKNRLIQEFMLNFLAVDHSIDWGKLLRFNSSIAPPQRLKVIKKTQTGSQIIMEEVTGGENTFITE